LKEWIVGRNPIYETLRAQRRTFYQLWVAKGVNDKGRVTDILHQADQRDFPVKRVPRGQLDSLGDGHQGAALEVSAYPYQSIHAILDYAEGRGDPPFILILDTLQDPQNLGTLLRTAEAVGVHGVLLPLRRTATVTPAVVSASSGASEHLLLAQANLAQAISILKDVGVWVFGLDASPEARRTSQVDLKGSLAIVVGNEATGMRPLVRESCDFLVRIPMRGMVESLNAAVAGSIALYLAWEARGYS
jgi:23S rRNA (guanosine2251-2'-O)-methyltransferase